MEAVLAIFADIDDPRDHTAQYELPALLLMALPATLCGARSCVDIADFAAANRADLADIVDLPASTTPSHDTFSRLFRLLDPEQLQAALRRFAAALREGLGLRPAQGTVAVDGKRLRRGYERGRAHMPPLMVGIWDAETRLSLAARAGADGNEVAATLAALKTVSVKGCVVTGDALHCHPAMARQVRAQGGHYLLKLKANHGRAGPRAVCIHRRRGAGHAAMQLDRGRSQRPDRAPLRLCISRSRDGTRLPWPRGIRTDRQRADEAWRQDREQIPVRGHVITPAGLAHAVDHATALERGEPPPPPARRGLSRRRRQNPQGQRAGQSSVIRRMALDILRAHPLPRSIARKMNLARWDRPFFLELFSYMR